MLALSNAVAVAQEHLLPIGTALTFICDDALNPRTAHAGGSVRVHLRDPLALDGETIAAAGTRTNVVVVDRVTGPNGTPLVRIAFGELKLRAQAVPLAPVEATVGALSVGTRLTAKTMGSIEQRAGQLIVRVPLPGSLSGEAPNPFFSPVPARTAGPRFFSPRPVRRPTPLPTPTSTPTPQ